MAEIEVPVYCYWNGCIKYGPEGVYYEGSTPKKIIVHPKIALNRLLDEMYVLTGVHVDKQRSKVKIFGRYPSVVGQSELQYLLLPVVNNHSLETMLEVPSKHPSIQNVELYLKVKSVGVIGPAACSSKRQRNDIAVKLEMDNRNMLIEDEADADEVGGGDLTYKSSGLDTVAQVVHLTRGDNSNPRKDLNKESSSGVSKPCLSSLWLEDHDLRVGLCFKGADELKKAVDWCSIKGMRKCVARETGTDECMFKCVWWKCKWSLGAAKMEKHGGGLFEIVKYTGPHTCRPLEPENFYSEFEADETERVVRVNPTLSVAELNNWWKEIIGYEIETKDVQAAKEEAIKRAFGDWDQSFEDLPKLMSAFQSSNGLLVDWKYDLFPNPKFASFCGVFWAFPQSIQGFQHCRPLILVDTKELKGKYQLKLMIASCLDASDYLLPLAFAVTKEVSSDSWRWFLTNIREKVTQKKGLCLISSPHPDILAAINEPGSQWQEPWAYHRFCLKHFSSQLCRDFPGYYQLENLVKQAGSTGQKEDFETYMERIKKENPEARRRLDRIPQNQWALVHDGGRRYGITEIDSKFLFAVCRGFDLAGHAVTGSILLLFDELRVWFDDCSLFSRAFLNCGDVYTKPVTDKLEEFRRASVAYVVMPSNNNEFQVAAPSRNYKWIVQLNDSTCTCGDFQSYKFPCPHALAVCKKLKINPLQYVDDCYSFERYYKTYEAAFSPVPELSAWPEASGVPRMFPPVIPPPPPPSYVAQHKTTPKTNNNKKS